MALRESSSNLSPRRGLGLPTEVADRKRISQLPGALPNHGARAAQDFPSPATLCFGSIWLPVRSQTTITSESTACELTIVGAGEFVDPFVDPASIRISLQQKAAVCDTEGNSATSVAHCLVRIGAKWGRLKASRRRMWRARLSGAAGAGAGIPFTLLTNLSGLRLPVRFAAHILC
jgi:hypothetical protein